MKQLEVRTDVSGAHVVVFNGKDHYIESRKDNRHPDKAYIEHVRGGQVRCHYTVAIEHAPAKVVQLMREYMT